MCSVLLLLCAPKQIESGEKHAVLQHQSYVPSYIKVSWFGATWESFRASRKTYCRPPIAYSIRRSMGKVAVFIYTVKDKKSSSFLPSIYMQRQKAKHMCWYTAVYKSFRHSCRCPSKVSCLAFWMKSTAATGPRLVITFLNRIERSFTQSEIERFSDLHMLFYRKRFYAYLKPNRFPTLYYYLL